MLKNLKAHAYLVIGYSGETESELGIEKGSPDTFLFIEPLFGIEEARKLVELAGRTSFTGKKTFFITPDKITLEAQNALLKTFEEPTPNTQFFLCVSDDSIILSTLKSRMQFIRVQSRVSPNGASKFLKLPLKERLLFAKKFADDEKNLPVFLDELLLAKRNLAVYKMCLLANDRTASPRLILEHLALFV